MIRGERCEKLNCKWGGKTARDKDVGVRKMGAAQTAGTSFSSRSSTATFSPKRVGIILLFMFFKPSPLPFVLSTSYLSKNIVFAEKSSSKDNVNMKKKTRKSF
jgi:hypothetical protein